MSRVRMLLAICLSAMLWAPLPIRADGKKDEKVDPLDCLTEAAGKWDRIDTFSAVFTRRERLDGEERLYNEQVIFMRGRRKPFSVYMKWIGEEQKGREAAYIEGQNDNKFKGRLGGIAGLVVISRKPDDPMVFKYSRHTILEAGFWNLIERLKARMTGADEVARTFYKGVEKFNGRDCHKFLRYLPDKKDKDGKNVYYAWKVEMWYDIEYKLPVVLRMYDWDKKIFEEYTYKDVVENPPLTDDDFQLGSYEE